MLDHFFFVPGQLRHSAVSKPTNKNTPTHTTVRSLDQQTIHTQHPSEYRQSRTGHFRLCLTKWLSSPFKCQLKR
jgi:hypothetical protein